MFEDEVKSRQKLSKGQGKKGRSNRSNLNDDTDQYRSREHAATAVNVSGTSVQRAIKVLNKESDELIQAVDQGDVKLGAVEKLDHNFQQECLVWLEGFRGEDFVDELEQLILDHGEEEATRRTLHLDMCDQTRECYRAAINYLSRLPA